ncbi:hypothetical protein ACET3Z_019181 [Daucus carota]
MLKSSLSWRIFSLIWHCILLLLKLLVLLVFVAIFHFCRTVYEQGSAISLEYSQSRTSFNYCCFWTRDYWWLRVPEQPVLHELIIKSLSQTLYHALPMDYIAISKLRNMLEGESNQTSVRKLIDKMTKEGFVEAQSNKRLGNV